MLTNKKNRDRELPRESESKRGNSRKKRELLKQRAREREKGPKENLRALLSLRPLQLIALS
jgi:hypothetical protein